MSKSKTWVEIGRKPFATADDDGYRHAVVEAGYDNPFHNLHVTPVARVAVAIRDAEDEEPELIIAYGAAVDDDQLGMNTLKEVKFRGDVALAVAAVLGAASRQLARRGGDLFDGGVTVTIEEG